MALGNKPSILTLVCVLLVAASLNATNSTVSSNVTGVLSGDDSQCKNVYNYNSNFYAGVNKEMEAMLHEVKEQLRVLRDENKYLKGNQAICNGMQFLSSVLITLTIGSLQDRVT